jgi:molecular chaperone DnaK
MTASQKFAEVLYQRTQAEQAAGGGSDPSGDDEVVEAEVVDEGEEKSA